MSDQPKIIADNPIGARLDDFRNSINTKYNTNTLESLGQEDLRNLAVDLVLALQRLPISRLLRSRSSNKNLLVDLSRLIPAISSDDFDFSRVKPLLKAALADEPVDALIWDEVYNAVTESTPPPRSIISSIHQTPWLRNTSSFVNSSEHRKYVDDVLKEELGLMYVGIRDFHETYFGGVADLKTVSEAFFEQCQQGSSPRFDDNNGWQGWPVGARQDGVLSWFTDFSEELATFAKGRKPTLTYQRKPLATPNDIIDGSTRKRKMDIGFVNMAKPRNGSKYHWSQILIPGELKSSPLADKASEAWLDLGRYAREVLLAQDSRRFVLGFTICGSLMRVWVFNRLGSIASDSFDINKNGLRFISTMLGFLWIDEEQLGFDPTITTEGEGKGKRRVITITRNGQTERLIINKVMKRAPCIAGRATTCWKAYREDCPQTPLVIKDSWQYTERDEEGELLREATDKSVVNMARYYHHETILVRGQIDDIQSNVRGGLDVMEAVNYRPQRPARLLSTGAVDIPRKGRSTNTAGVKQTSSQAGVKQTASQAGVKRTSSQAGASLPPSKRTCSASSSTKAATGILPNRVHRRVIVHDFGKPIYEASSCSALLGALEGCIKGHESLHDAGFLHRDISVNNLMINEDADNPSWPAFLIDLDLAIKKSRDGPSGAKGKTGTRAFMAIGTLNGEQHSFMHDLESFFWVLFWICVHSDGPGKSRIVPWFDKWNFVDTEGLAISKRGVIADEAAFLRIMEAHFTSSFQSLMPWVNRLRRAVFPNGTQWKTENPQLYSSMMDILRQAREDPSVSV